MNHIAEGFEETSYCPDCGEPIEFPFECLECEKKEKLEIINEIGE